MGTINNIKELIEAYNNGQRAFFDVDIETQESLEGIDLSNSSFENCFFFIDFSQSILKNVSFNQCNLKGCDFKYADLTNSSITNCSVEGLSLKNALLKHFNFDNNYCYSGIAGKDDLVDFINYDLGSDIY